MAAGGARQIAVGLDATALSLTAKDKICFAKEGECSPDDCDFARGHYDRIHTAVDELFGRPAFTRQAIEAAPKAHRVCPFELSLEIALLGNQHVDDGAGADLEPGLGRLEGAFGGNHRLVEGADLFDAGDDGAIG